MQTILADLGLNPRISFHIYQKIIAFAFQWTKWLKKLSAFKIMFHVDGMRSLIVAWEFDSRKCKYWHTFRHLFSFEKCAACKLENFSICPGTVAGDWKKVGNFFSINVDHARCARSIALELWYVRRILQKSYNSQYSFFQSSGFYCFWDMMSKNIIVGSGLIRIIVWNDLEISIKNRFFSNISQVLDSRGSYLYIYICIYIMYMHHTFIGTYSLRSFAVTPGITFSQKYTCPSWHRRCR